MRLYTFLSVLMVATLLTGCTFANGIAGSGKTVTLEQEVAGFSQVSIGSAFTADITRSDTFSVVITIDDNLAKYLKVVNDGNTLKIYLEMGAGLSLRGNNVLKAKITLPELTGLHVSGASTVTVAGFKSAKELAVDVSGASTLKGDISTGDTRIVISGASSVTLQGAGRNLNLKVSGASKARLENFTVTDAGADVSGASSATVSAQGRLDVTASGASKLYYTGNPTVGRINSSGASSVERK